LLPACDSSLHAFVSWYGFGLGATIHLGTIHNTIKTCHASDIEHL
jgi:hypothetical protein